MSAFEAQVTGIYARLAEALSADGDLHALLTELLEPIAFLSQARVASVGVRAGSDGRLQLLGAIERARAAAGEERVVLIPLTCRHRTLGQYELRVPAAWAPDEATARFHQTLGALLGLALHDAGVEHESRQAVLADVHDSIAQNLVFVRMRLPLLEDAISRRDDASAMRYSGELRQAVTTAHTNLRAMLMQDHTPMDPKGLKQALASSVQSFQELTQINVAVDDQAPDLRLSASQEWQVYLIVQEALSNIARHARARHAWLGIARRGNQVDVVVEDDGTGPPQQMNTTSPSHFGLEIMRHRAARLGGGIEIAARGGGGMCLRLSFPIAEMEVAGA